MGIKHEQVTDYRLALLYHKRSITELIEIDRIMLLPEIIYVAAIPEISHISDYLVVIRLCALGNFHFQAYLSI